MINIKPIVIGAMDNDAALIAILGAEKVLHCNSIEEMDLPCIAYSEIGNDPLDFGDEQEVTSKITYQFDILTKPGGDTSQIALIVEQIMIGLGGTRESAPDDDSIAPKECRVMVYSFIVDNELNFY
ncbi:hypothetical protein M7775_19130 [Sporomusa sphaeroides DSM 2875]|uniref:hypothetical protein n=1 Tax=Sporomusa sphaeroides TaxID=47679 RepID=UPI002030AB78|nr:hypothetical protein [Sporomusa sphaeroides]MCM0760667.1 hypothetical protein [Sporomusa sphaeroides DSM 2875]